MRRTDKLRIIDVVSKPFTHPVNRRVKLRWTWVAFWLGRRGVREENY